MPSIYQRPIPKRMTPEEFRRWVSESPWGDTQQWLVSMFGKPRVRVPVERQVPNEADL